MARKCVYITKPNFVPTRGMLQVKVYRDSEWEELVARLYINGTLVPAADYFIMDCRYDSAEMKAATLEDACNTANSMAGF